MPYSVGMLRRLVLLCLPAALLIGADKPNLSGRWVADLAKSDFGMMPPPEKMERQIEQTDTELKLKSIQTANGRESTSEYKITTDGKETAIQIRGRDAKVSAAWEGANLVVSTKMEFNGMAISQKETWVLASDGKSLTCTNLVNTPQGDLTVKILLNKQ